MAFRYFIGKSREWLEEMLDEAQEELARGRSQVGWGAGDQSSSKKVEASPEERIRKLLNDLHAIAPEDYPLTSIRQPSVTQARFHDQ